MKRRDMVGWICVLSGLGAIAWGSVTATKALQSRSWLDTPGVVVQSTLVQGSSGTRTASRSSFKPHVEYDYDVDGKTLRGDRISFRIGIALSAGHAQQIVDDHPVGKQVTVFFNPDDPTQSTLRTGANAATFAVPGFGAALLIAGVVMVRRRQ